MRTVLLFIACWWVQACAAQDSLFTSIERLSRTAQWVGVVDADSNSFLVLRQEQSKEESLVFTRFSRTTCQPMAEHVYKMSEWFGAGAGLKGWLKLRESLVLFAASEGDEVIWQAASLSFDASTKGVPRIVYNEHSQRNTPRFRWNISPDSTCFLFYTSSEKAKEENELYTLTEYNQNLEELWSKDLRLPQKPGTAEITEVFPDDSSGVYFVSTSVERKSDFASTTMEYGNYVVYYFNYTDNRLKEYEVSLKEKQIVHMRGAMRKNGALVLGGYYSNRSDERVAGTFLFEINSGGSGIRTARYSAFSDALLEEFAEGKRFRKRGGISHFYLDHVLVLPDNSVVLVGEQFRRIEQYMNDVSSGRMMVEYTYHYDDVVLSRMDTVGNVIWNLRVPKQQYSYSNDPACSYALWARGTSVHLFFNDDAGNNAGTSRPVNWIARAWFNARLGVTTQVEVCDDGSVLRNTYIENEKTQLLFQPNTSSEMNAQFPVASYREAREVRYLPLKIAVP